MGVIDMAHAPRPAQVLAMAAARHVGTRISASNVASAAIVALEGVQALP
jgi:hypothetical protein